MNRATKELAAGRHPLAEVVDFDEGELAPNHSGELSAAERQLLGSVRRSMSTWTWIAALVLGARLAGRAGIVISQTDGQCEPLIAVLAVCGLAVALFVGSVVRGWWVERDLRAGRGPSGSVCDPTRSAGTITRRTGLSRRGRR